VLVEGIPNQLRSTVTLGTYFETMYPNAVLSVRCGQDTQYLDRLIEQRLDAVTKLEVRCCLNALSFSRTPFSNDLHCDLQLLFMQQIVFISVINCFDG
jgi:hypothetical protein